MQGKRGVSQEPRSYLRVCKGGIDPVGWLHNFPWHPEPSLYQDNQTTLLPKNPHGVERKGLPSNVLDEALLGQVIVSDGSNSPSKETYMFR